MSKRAYEYELLISDVLAAANDVEKTASVTYALGATGTQLLKLAEGVRDVAKARITYADLTQFKNRYDL